MAKVGDFAVATDGRRLLAIKGIDAEERKDFPIVVPWINREPEGAEIPFARLVECAGEFQLTTERACDECDGRGNIRRMCDYCPEEHDCKCDCGGGRIVNRPKSRTCNIGPAIIDLQMLSGVLPHLKSKTVRIDAPGKTEKVMIFGDGWVFLVMPTMYETATKTLDLGKA